MYEVGQALNLERNPIYASSVNNCKLQERTRTISEVWNIDDERTGIRFKGSKIWYTTTEGSEWIQSRNVKYRII